MFMKDDEIRLNVEQDRLILKFGCRIHDNHKDPRNLQNVSSKMRDLARLVISAKSVSSDIIKLEDLLQPCNFEILVKPVRKACRYDGAKNDQTPSLALKL